MHDLALAGKCGCRGAKGFVEGSSLASTPSFHNIHASAKPPNPEAVDVKNWRRANVDDTKDSCMVNAEMYVL